MPNDVSPNAAEIGQAVAAAISKEEAKSAHVNWKESYKIEDPGNPKTPEPEATEQPRPTEKLPEKQEVIRGATADNGLTADLLRRAREVDIDEEEAKQYSGVQLEKMVRRLEDAYEPEVPYGQYQMPPYGWPQQQQPWPQQQLLQQQQQWYAAQQQAQWQQPQQFQPVPLPTPEATDENGQPLQWDPGFVKAWNQNQEIIARQNQALAQVAALHQQTTAQFQQMQAQMQQQRDVETRQRLDQLFQADEGYQDVFGKGGLDEVYGTREHRERLAVADAMTDIAYGRARRGVQPLSEATLYEQAKRQIYGDRAATKQTIQRLRNSEGQFISRPTATTRGSQDTPGYETAVRKVEEAMNGYSSGM